ncbi:hypothetical protein RZE82_01435 [Mollicutes bacterium LVI A0039]|nr:hypothetical protein RZE82_01435 [Mollicutes bacterium LVI A0039]
MKNQNMKSFKQVVTQEYKVVLLYIFVILLVPIIAQVSMIDILSTINNATLEQKIAILYSATTLNTVNFDLLRNLGFIVNVLAVLFFAPVFARKLNGQRLLHSLRDAFKDIKSKRFWNYIIKVYVPIVVALIAISYLIEATASPVMKIIVGSPILAIIFSILLIILLIIIATLMGVSFVANIAYLRGTNRIKDVLKSIPNRELVKLILFNSLVAIIVTAIVAGFVVPLLSISILELIASILSILIKFLIVFIIIQPIISYLRINLYLNIASKIKVKL